MDLTVTTQTTLQSVTVDFVKKSGRITQAIEDDIVLFNIKTADDYIQNECNISLMARTFTLRVPKILSKVSLYRPPLISIGSISYTPKDGVATNLAHAGLAIKKSHMIPFVETGLDDADGEMTIVYTAGYATPDDVPQSLKHAAVLMANHYFTSREAAYMDVRLKDIEKRIPFGVPALINPFKVINHGPEINGGV